MVAVTSSCDFFTFVVVAVVTVVVVVVVVAAVASLVFDMDVSAFSVILGSLFFKVVRLSANSMDGMNVVEEVNGWVVGRCLMIMHSDNIITYKQ